MQDEPKNPKRPMPLFVGLGVAVGAALGVALGNIAVGIAVGAAIGADLSMRGGGKEPDSARFRVFLGRLGRLMIWSAFAAVLLVRAGSNTEYLSRSLFASGPNTVGEAGKVYFASKFQTGAPKFASGDVAPFYPSIHGVLVHAPVGLLGKVLGASTSQLYWIGRSISVMLTVLAWGLLFALGRRMRIGYPLLLTGLVLWMGTYSINQHTTSYRPDNWLLFLSVLSVWLLVKSGGGKLTAILLAIIPVVAFHVKAPGICLVGAIGLALLVQGHRTKSMALVLAQVGLLLTSIMVIDLSSGGTYLQAMGTAGDVGLSSRNLLLSLADRVLLFTLLLPGVLFLLPVFRRTVKNGPVLRTMVVFWAVTAASYGVAAARAGSNTYYFLEPMTFGILIVLAWLSASQQEDASRTYTPYLLVIFLAGFSEALEYANSGHPVDAALFQTEQVGEAREDVADLINTESAFCFSDDPGLNVLLQKPAIIHPLNPMLSVEAGSHGFPNLIQPLRRHEYDCVVLTGLQWSYRGVSVMPDSFYLAVAEEYQNTERLGAYIMYSTR